MGAQDISPGPFTGKAVCNVQDFQNVPSLTSGIQEAMDSLPDTGGMVFVPPGTYLLHRPIALRANSVLMGAGKSTILKKDDEFCLRLTEDAKKGQDYILVKDASKVTLGIQVVVGDDKPHRRITYYTRATVKAVEGNRIILSSKMIRDYVREADARMMNQFPIVIPGQNTITRDLAMNGNRANQSQRRDKDLAGWESTGVWGMGGSCKVVNCWIYDMFQDGIMYCSYDSGVVADCTIYGCGNMGIHLGGGPKAIITGNEIYNNSSDGIFFCYGNWGVVIDGNLVHHNAGQGIGGIGTGNPEMDRTHDRYSVISNNMIFHNGHNGIYTSGEARDFVITGNICMDNGQDTGQAAGISLVEVSGMVVSGNRCLDDQDYWVRPLLQDARAGQNQVIIKETGGGRCALEVGQKIRISSGQASEVHAIASIKPGGGGYALSLEAKLQGNYTAEPDGKVVPLKTQAWGIIEGWSKDANTGNVIMGNICNGNLMGGILWVGTDTQVQGNVGTVVKIEEKKSRKTYFAPVTSGD